MTIKIIKLTDGYCAYLESRPDARGHGKTQVEAVQHLAELWPGLFLLEEKSADVEQD